MNEYTPDAWVIIRITGAAAAANGPIYKVIGGWHDGYPQGAVWRLNSGVTWIDPDGDHFVIHGHSGSTYRVHKNAQHTTRLMNDVLNRLKEAAEAEGSLIEVVDIAEVEL